MLRSVLRPTISVGLTLAGVACALTLVFLSMRSVMNVGGFCAEGGPYKIRQHCPQGVPAIMPASIFGGLLLAFVYAWTLMRNKIPGLAGLLWPALFLSLGWNFFEYAFDAPGNTSGVVWGWLICGIVFALMGGLPLLALLPATLRGFLRGEEHPAGWPAGVPVAHFQNLTARLQPSDTGSNPRLVGELERLAKLHEQGALDDDEYASAKRKVLGEDAW
jgi:hypothetical protein